MGGDDNPCAAPVPALQVVEHGVGHAVQAVADLFIVHAEERWSRISKVDYEQIQTFHQGWEVS